MNNHQERHPPLDPVKQLSILRIIWGSMLTSQLLFAFVAAMQSPEESDLTQGIILCTPALFTALGSLLWGRSLAQSQPMQARWLVRWAFAEATALFGLVCWFTSGALAPTIAVMGLGFLLVAAQWPRFEDQDVTEMMR